MQSLTNQSRNWFLHIKGVCAKCQMPNTPPQRVDSIPCGRQEGNAKKVFWPTSNHLLQSSMSLAWGAHSMVCSTANVHLLSLCNPEASPTW